MKHWRVRIKLITTGVFLPIGLITFSNALSQLTGNAPQRAEAAAWGASERATGDKAQSPVEQNPTAEAENYVGAETCRVCHPSQYQWLSRTAHFATIRSEKFMPPTKGCEMCHGPGKQHVEAGGGPVHIFNPRKASAREVVTMCTNCHQEKRLDQCDFHQNQHNVETVACHDCHNPHQQITHRYILRDKSPALCFTCHREIKAEFARPFHHKVPEGAMDCRDCHQQHGSLNRTQTVELTGGLSAICLRCHTDKQGPFVFEHNQLNEGRFLGDRCLTCHTPHGSINNRLLVRSEVRLLCQECHFDRQGASGDLPQGIHDLTSPRYQHCTSCHVMIHGSNTSRLFLR